MTSEPEHRVTIRLATERDTGAIAPLLAQLGYPRPRTSWASGSSA